MFSIKSILLTTTSFLALATATPNLVQLRVSFGTYGGGCLQADGTYIETDGNCSSLFDKQDSGAGFTFTTANGPCGLVGDLVQCNAAVTPAIFQNDDLGVVLDGIHFTAVASGDYLEHKADTLHGNFITLVAINGIL